MIFTCIKIEIFFDRLNGARVTEREIRAFLNPFLLKLIECKLLNSILNLFFKNFLFIAVAGDPSISIDVPENGKTDFSVNYFI